MKRVAICLSLAVIALALPVHGQGRAFKCILTGNCTPPPCEYFAQLNLTKATVRALAKLPAPDSTNDSAFDQFSVSLQNKVGNALNKYSKCRVPDSPARTYTVGPYPACEIGTRDSAGTFTPVDLDQAKKLSQTCSEIVEAHYERLEVRQEQCTRLVVGGGRHTVAMRRAEMMLRYQAELDSLRGSLLRYLSSCAPDANLAAELTNLGLDSLMKDGKAAYDEWQASRASGTVAGAR